jgi:hypothetical protein
MKLVAILGASLVLSPIGGLRADEHVGPHHGAGMSSRAA